MKKTKRVKAGWMIRADIVATLRAITEAKGTPPQWTVETALLEYFERQSISLVTPAAEVRE